MTRRATLSVSSLLFLSLTFCAAPPPPVTVPAQQSGGSRVLLVSFDGVAWDALDEVRPQLSESGWNRIRREGTAARMITVDPSTTAATHVSMATGALPSRTGIVSNVIHLPGTAADQTVSGFDAPIEVEPIWVAAMKGGKRVGAITYPGLDGTSPDRTAHWGLIYTQPVARSRFQNLTRADFRAAPSPIHRRSFSPVQLADLNWEWRSGDLRVSSPVQLIALDGTDDGVENYDHFTIRHRDHDYAVDQTRWFPLSAELPEQGSPHLFGSWSKLIEVQPDLSRVTIYWGSVSRSRGYPESYRQMIDREVGFWPGPPDDWAAEQWILQRKGIDPATYAEQTSRFSDFFTRATLVSKQRMDWDLLLAYQPIVDEIGHQWFIVNDRQLAATPENLEAAAAMRLHGHRVFDAAVARLLEGISGSENLIVVSDHGMMPIDTTVRINRLLTDWGYASTGDEGRLAPDTRWAAYTSTAYAVLHAFGEPRSEEIEELAQRLRGVRAPDGRVVFDRVHVSGPESHPRQGALQAWLSPGFTYTSSASGEIFTPSRYYGQHGFLSHYPAMHAIAGAFGPAVGELPEAIAQTSIAGWVARLLGVEPPAAAAE